METIVSEIMNEPKTPKWLRYTGVVLIHLFLTGNFLLLSLRCFKIGIPAGGVLFAALLAGCICTLVFMLKRIRKRRPIRSGKKDSRKRAVAGCLLSLAVLAFGLPFALSACIYESNFNERYETYAPTSFHLQDFQGLEVEGCTFPSNSGQKLAGYTYFKGGKEKKGVVVIAHGLGGGGHNTYMDIADYFASNGYLVFAYDATGNDNSEGKSVRGLPQGIIDLDYALRYVKTDEKMKNLPIVLFGHSWGAYAACAVLNRHPDVKAVVAGAGFNRSIDMIESQGRTLLGDGISVLLPYVSLYEFLKFGRYADYAAMSGFEKSEARLMVLHSADDTTVPPSYGYDRYIKKYGDDSRFTFVRFEDHGHDGIFNSDASRLYQDQFNKDFGAYVASLDTALTAEIKENYLKAHLDKSKAYELDAGLFQDILAFYDESIQQEAEK